MKKGFLMSEARLKRFLLITASVFAAAAICYALFAWVIDWLLPFLIAGAGVCAIEPAVRFLQRRFHFRRQFSSLVLTLFLLLLLGGLLSLLGTALKGQADALLRGARDLPDRAQAALDGFFARIERYGAQLPAWLRDALETALRRRAAEAENLFDALLRRLLSALSSLASALPQLMLGTATCVLAVYYFSCELPELRQLASNRLPDALSERVGLFRSGAVRTVSRWLRAELTLCAVTFCELLAGLSLLRQPYALLLALLITLVDALPVFGAGTILVPWAASELLFGSAAKAAALAALYLVTLLVRNALEPKLLGKLSGLPASFSLLAMYLGFCVFGIGGMILFPFLLMLAAQLRRLRGEAADPAG